MYEELVKLHERRISNIAMAMLGNVEDAKDAWQDTFLRAFTKIDTFRFECQFSTWLSRIVINQCINLRRKKRLRGWLSLTEGEAKTLTADEKMEPDRMVLSGEFASKIEMGLSQLSTKQRSVFILKHFQGYKIREIAEIMNWSEGTVKNALFRAMQKMKKALHSAFKNGI